MLTVSLLKIFIKCDTEGLRTESPAADRHVFFWILSRQWKRWQSPILVTASCCQSCPHRSPPSPGQKAPGQHQPVKLVQPMRWAYLAGPIWSTRIASPGHQQEGKVKKGGTGGKTLLGDSNRQLRCVYTEGWSWLEVRLKRRTRGLVMPVWAFAFSSAADN